MFPSLRSNALGVDALETVAAWMAAHPPRDRDNVYIPAGYTYFGQFVDHDITFDPASVLERDNDPEALVNFRTPRFDLDSLYGSGPADQPFLYDWGSRPHGGVKLLLDVNEQDERYARVDLPRNSQGRALIGDARNDENLIVSQLHLLLIRFHNAVVDHVHARTPHLAAADLLEEAQRIVRWHYQWIVVHDFLERIVGKAMAASVLRPGDRGAAPTVDCRFYRCEDEPFVPVEFSAGAYRFGHSMVRSEYSVNRDAQSVPLFPAHDGSARHLGGLRRLPAQLVIDWGHFFSGALPSMRINPSLAAPLLRLPPDGASLPRLNLLRGRALGLPCGADIAAAVGCEALSADELLPDEAAREKLRPEVREGLLRTTPLWYYVLCEARKAGPSGGDGGRHLGPAGGRIVAETLVGLLAGDPRSYLSQRPTWTPELTGSGEVNFTLPDLVRFALSKPD
jgi:hypothetical protein